MSSYKVIIFNNKNGALVKKDMTSVFPGIDTEAGFVLLDTDAKVDNLHPYESERLLERLAAPFDPNDTIIDYKPSLWRQIKDFWGFKFTV